VDRPGVPEMDRGWTVYGSVVECRACFGGWGGGLEDGEGCCGCCGGGCGCGVETLLQCSIMTTCSTGTGTGNGTPHETPLPP